MALTPIIPVIFDQDELVVAICRGATPEGHTGLAFFDESNGLIVCHLVDHRALRLDAARPEWLIQRLGLGPLIGKQLVAYAREVVKWASQLNNIDYGVDFLAARGSFLAGGEYVPPLGEPGLTCASFVVEVLRGMQVELVDERTWKPTLYNADWQESVADIFARRAAAAEVQNRFHDARVCRARVAAISKPLTGLRLMPTEVIGAASMGRPAWPVTFEDVQPAAQNVRDRLAVV